MPSNSLFDPQVVIKVSGTELAPNQAAAISAVEVDSSLYMPSMLTVRFFEPPDVNRSEPNPPSLDSIAKVGLPIECKVTTAGGSQAQSVTETLFKGEITSVEAEFLSNGFGGVTVRAYDKGHRLMRMHGNRVLKQVTDSDIISQLASESGLSASCVATTEVHSYVIQGSQSDYEFMRDLSRRNGLAMWVNGDTLTTKAWSDFSTAELTIEFGQTLIEFRPRVTSVGQMGSVSVTSWDPKSKQAIVASAATPSLMNTIGSRTVNDLSKTFSDDAQGIIQKPMISTGEATKLAQARLDGARGGDVQAEGVASGDPRILAGKRVEIKGTTENFNGKYLITRATHRLNSEGYVTAIESTNGSGETLTDVVAGPAPTPMFGLVVGIVTDNDDPDGMGRVKVKFPWMQDGDSKESNWARIVTPMAGSSMGLQLMPEINDEVLVGFEHGDPNFPYIMGALWNGVDKPPLPDAVSSGQVVKRQLKTRAGHTLTFDDTSGSEKIEIKDQTGNSITILSADKKIEVTSTGDVSVTAQGNASVTAKGDVKVDATGKLSMKSSTEVEVTATSGMTLKATGQMKIEGAMVTIKGNMVQIN